MYYTHNLYNKHTCQNRMVWLKSPATESRLPNTFTVKPNTQRKHTQKYFIYLSEQYTHNPFKLQNIPIKHAKESQTFHPDCTTRAHNTEQILELCLSQVNTQMFV